MTEENDISLLFDKLELGYVLKISLCHLTLEETEEIVRKCNKVEINIGDGLTLLHQAASHDRPDLVNFLCEQGHSTEVKTKHGETPLDQAAWRGQISSAIALLA